MAKGDWNIVLKNIPFYVKTSFLNWSGPEYIYLVSVIFCKLSPAASAFSCNLALLTCGKPAALFSWLLPEKTELIRMLLV